MNALHHCYTNRYGIYYFRLRIPAPLLQYAGQSEVRFSLRTKQRRIAAIRASRALNRALSILAAVAAVTEKRMDKDTSEPMTVSASEMQSYWGYLLEQNNNNEVDAINALTRIAIEWIIKCRPEQADEIHARYDREDLEEIGFAVMKRMASEAVTPDETLKGTAPARVEIDHKSAGYINPIKTIKDAIDTYILQKKSDKESGLSAEDESRLRVLQALMEAVADGRPLAELTAEDWYKCFDLPRYLPKNTAPDNITELVPDMLSALNSGNMPKTDRIGKYVLANHQRRVIALCKLSFDREWIRKHFLDEARPNKSSRKERAKESYKTMKPEEIHSLLHGYLYQSGPRSDRREKQLEWRFWMLPVALYTGMRQQEIAQLSVSDLRTDQDTGIVYIDVNEDEPGKKVKSNAGIRVIPLHNELVRSGFIDYVEELVKRGEKHLFPDLWINSKNQPLNSPETGRVNKYFNGDGGTSRGYFKACGIVRDKVVFHSARHTFVNRLRQLDVADEKIAGLVGHEKLHMTAHYGDDHHLKLLKDVIDKLDYGPEGSLDHISIAEYRKRFKSRARTKRPTRPKASTKHSTGLNGQ